MSEIQETVREVCAEIKARSDLDGGDMCDNFHIEYGDYGAFDGLELIKAYADRIIVAHEREMAAKDAEIARLKAALALACRNLVKRMKSQKIGKARRRSMGWK